MAGLAESAVLGSSLGLSSSVEKLKGAKEGGRRNFDQHSGGRKNSNGPGRDRSLSNLRIVAAGENNGNRRTSSYVENGAAGSGRQSSSRYNMIPIDEAVRRPGNDRSYVSSNVMINGAANGSAGQELSTYDSVSLNGAIKGGSNGISGLNGSSTRTSTVKGNDRSASNGIATSNGSSRIRQADPVETKVNGAAIANGSSTRKIVVRAPVQLPVIDESLRVLSSDEGFSWSRSNYNRVQRTIDVWSFVLALRARVFLLDSKWTYIGGFTEEKKKKRTRGAAAWVRETILQLGPTFIKLGQLSSTRSDLFPADFVEELAKLQDRVPAFSAEKAIALIEKELGASIDELFAQFERQPIAAASLGQVHRAVLYNGEKVAVKLQRPGLKELFDIDLGKIGRSFTGYQGVKRDAYSVLINLIGGGAK